MAVVNGHGRLAQLALCSNEGAVLHFLIERSNSTILDIRDLDLGYRFENYDDGLYERRRNGARHDRARYLTCVYEGGRASRFLFVCASLFGVS